MLSRAVKKHVADHRAIPRLRFFRLFWFFLNS